MIKILLSVQDDWLLWEVGSDIGFPSLLHPSLRFLMLKCFMKHFPALNFLSVKFWHLTGFVSRRLPPSPLDLPSLRSLWLLASVSPQESSLVFFYIVFVTGKSVWSLSPWHEETPSVWWCNKNVSIFSICQRRWWTTNWKKVNRSLSLILYIIFSPRQACCALVKAERQRYQNSSRSWERSWLNWRTRMRELLLRGVSKKTSWLLPMTSEDLEGSLLYSP